jgi:hypothetical protein
MITAAAATAAKRARLRSAGACTVTLQRHLLSSAVCRFCGRSTLSTLCGQGRTNESGQWSLGRPLRSRLRSRAYHDRGSGKAEPGPRGHSRLGAAFPKTSGGSSQSGFPSLHCRSALPRTLLVRDDFVKGARTTGRPTAGQAGRLGWAGRLWAVRASRVFRRLSKLEWKIDFR